MKRLSRLCLLAAGFAVAGGAYAQIPVTDGAHIALDISNEIQNFAQGGQQLAQLVSQYQQMVQQYSALTGNRGMGSLFDDPSYKNYLPTDWQSVYSKMASGGYNGISGSASSTYASNKRFDACAQITDSQRQMACQAQAVKPSVDQANLTTMLLSIQGQLTQIEQLTAQINQTQDPKAIAELQARIATVQATEQSAQTQIQMYTMLSQIQDNVQKQQRHELSVQSFSGTGYGTEKLQPLNFTN